MQKGRLIRNTVRKLACGFGEGVKILFNQVNTRWTFKFELTSLAMLWPFGNDNYVPTKNAF